MSEAMQPPYEDDGHTDRDDLGEVTPEGSAVDPFDPDALRINAEELETATRLLSVQARRPGRQAFFRVHPDPAYALDTYLFSRKVEQGEETYIVVPSLLNLPELAGDVKPYRIFTCLDRRGVLFLWPARLPTDDGLGSTWHRSALLAADRAQVKWIKLQGDRGAGCYSLVEALGDLGEPEWPNYTLRELLEMAYQDRAIKSRDHDVLRELRGEI